MGGTIPRHSEYPGEDLYPSNNGRHNPRLDLAHIKLKEILCLAVDELRMNRVSLDDRMKSSMRKQKIFH
ncbi:hypothetical protein BHE74_00045658 [Ensete ventricosum]|nr:hypothetical protein BHE74_00045658 [Ensete ventricosum]RZS09360.1 hypothetical protein BHM03_00040429 [Ensete ventricosum]